MLSLTANMTTFYLDFLCESRSEQTLLLYPFFSQLSFSVFLVPQLSWKFFSISLWLLIITCSGNLRKKNYRVKLSDATDNYAATQGHFCEKLIYNLKKNILLFTNNYGPPPLSLNNYCGSTFSSCKQKGN